MRTPTRMWETKCQAQAGDGSSQRMDDEGETGTVLAAIPVRAAVYGERRIRPMPRRPTSSCPALPHTSPSLPSLPTAWTQLTRQEQLLLAGLLLLEPRLADSPGILP